MRKVLSFVLVLALVLGSFSMAFGLTDVAGDAKEEAIRVCNNLDIIEGFEDGTFKPDQAVNRAQFAAMMTRALGIPESALAAYTATGFKDVAGYGWAVKYLAFCESKGIMEGDGMGNVMPGRTISVNEAITMVARALGYTNNSSVLVGTWPANYVSLGQDLGLYTKLAAASTVDRANAAQVIYNSLSVQKVQVNADGETNLLWDGPAVAGNEVTMLTSGLGCDLNAADIIEGTEPSLINLYPYMGAFAETYTNSDGDVVAIGEVKSTFLSGEYTVDAAANDYITVNSVKYYFNGTNPTLTTLTATDPAGQSFPDGVATPNAGSAFTALAVANGDIITVAVDLSNKTIKKVYSVIEWTAPVDGQFTSADIKGLADNEIFGVDFALDDDDAVIDDSYTLVGVNSLDDIAVDNVVYVYKYGAGHADYANKIARVEVGTETVEGTLNKISGSTYTIGATGYKFADATYYGATATRPSTGDGVLAYLDYNGKIYDYESTDAAADTYGVIIASQTSAAVDGAKVRLFDAVAADEVTFSYTTAVTLAPGDNGKLIGYALNSSGKVNDVDFATVSDAAMKVLSPKVLEIGATTTYAISGDVVVLVKTATGYDVSSIGKIQNTANLRQTVISAQAITNTSGVVVAMYVDDFDASKTVDDIYGVINSYDDLYDATLDDSVYNLVGFADGVAVDKNTVDQTVVANTAIANYATSVALFKISYDSDGYISALAAHGTAAPVVGVTITAVTNNNLSVKTTSAGVETWYEIDPNAVVYYVSDYGTADQEYSVSTVNGFRASSATTTYMIWLFDTDSDTAGYDTVVYTRY
jgi:hypothetical protein